MVYSISTRPSLSVTQSQCQSNNQSSSMVTRCKPAQHFQNRRLSLPSLAFVYIVTWHFSAGTAADIHLRGEVGGNVAIHCPFSKEKTIRFFYFQRGTDYVNGYHTLHDISSTETWNNTKVYRRQTTVHMYKLNVSHSGDYVCHIQYSDMGEMKTAIHLDVRANYSTPEVEVRCRDASSCRVTCASHGGYPGTRVTWNVSRGEAWQVVNAREIQDPDTMLVNSTSTAHFNCSRGEVRFLCCSVGDVTSEVISGVCTSTDSPDRSNPKAAVIAIGVVAAAALLLWGYRKRQTGAYNASQTGRVDESGWEEVALNQTEAP